MVDKNIWDERRRGFEEEFFAKKNRELIEKIRTEEEHKKARAELAEQTGIRNESVLESLVGAGVTTSTIIALAMVPLVLVAWADGQIEREERDALLKAAAEEGVNEESAAYELLGSWLTEQPSPRLFEAWSGYMREFRSLMDAESFTRLGNDVMQRAKAVAQAAGGFLGFIGHKISDAEKAELRRLEQVFQLH